MVEILRRILFEPSTRPLSDHAALFSGFPTSLATIHKQTRRVRTLREVTIFVVVARSEVQQTIASHRQDMKLSTM
jgi:hypothetical protein